MNDTLGIIKRLTQTNQKLSSLFTKLASGRRINRASDDAAGLSVVASLEVGARTLNQANRNIGDAVSAAQIRDGALDQIGQLKSRQAELAAQASNGTLSDSQRATLNQEFQALGDEINRIQATTEFNGVNQFSGEDLSIQAGDGGDSESQLTLQGTQFSFSSQDISTQAGAQGALDPVNQDIATVAEVRGKLGADVSRLRVAEENNATQAIEQESAAARIRDADIASLAADKVALEIKQKAGTAVLAQAKNLEPQNVLRLLK